MQRFPKSHVALEDFEPEDMTFLTGDMENRMGVASWGLDGAKMKKMDKKLPQTWTWGPSSLM